MTTDDRLERILGDLLADAAPRRAPARLRTDVLTTTSRIRPRRPWLVLPTHSLRYVLMSSSVKLAIVAALALSVGAVVAPVLAPPNQAPAASPSPTAGPVDPVEFSVSVSFGNCTGASVKTVGGVTQSRDETCALILRNASDPRLGGAWTMHVNHDVIPGGTTLWMGAYRVENAAGAWQQLPNLAFDLPDGRTTTKTVTLIGEGDYAGSTAIAEAVLNGNTWALRGFILGAELPPTPEEPAG